MAVVHALADALPLLEQARTLAVLGAHTDAGRAAHYVPAYLARQGYRILPVNPRFAGETLFGETVVATLADLPAPADLVDVCRPAPALPAHLPEILAMTPRPAVVWLQLGIRHDAVAQALSDAGLTVVQDRCTLADHRTGSLPRR